MIRDGGTMYGDTELIRRRVGQLREQGTEVRALADELVVRTDALGWSGRAAGAMRERVTDRANQLRVAADAHDRAADALARHLQVVLETQDRIAEIEDRAARLLEADASLAGFTAPPPGHQDWLTVELPGL